MKKTLAKEDLVRIEQARCPGGCVGARLRRRAADGSWEYMLIGRAWWPIGWAPVAGHREHWQTDHDAVVAEMSEEANLSVVWAEEMFSIYLPNFCKAPPHATRPGHQWTVFDVEVSGTLIPDLEETTGAEWVTADQLQELANVTIRHAVSGGAARDLPARALEAVWVKLYFMTGDISATEEELAAVGLLYATFPDEYWIG